MHYISDEIKQMVLARPFLEEAISRGIVNLSALARDLMRELEETMNRPVSEGAVMMALKRLSGKMHKDAPDFPESLRRMSNMTVFSDLSEFTYKRSPQTMKRLGLLIQEIQKETGVFFTFSHGTHEITLIISQALTESVKKVFKGERLSAELVHLSAISIKLPDETVETPGIHYSILKQLSWNRINIIEVVSTYTELTIVLERQHIDIAFSILIRYFQE